MLLENNSCFYNKGSASRFLHKAVEHEWASGDCAVKRWHKRTVRATASQAQVSYEPFHHCRKEWRGFNHKQLRPRRRTHMSCVPRIQSGHRAGKDSVVSYKSAAQTWIESPFISQITCSWCTSLFNCWSSADMQYVWSEGDCLSGLIYGC